MAETHLTPSRITPSVKVWGKHQRFEFSDPIIEFELYNDFVPTSTSDNTIILGFMNQNMAGYRFKQSISSNPLQDPNNYGRFYFQIFENAEDTAGTDIFSVQWVALEDYDALFIHKRMIMENVLNMGNHTIDLVASPVTNDQAANKIYVDSAIASIPAGTIALTGDVTGSGTVGTPFATTLALRLNQILTPTASVSLNSQKITSLANGTVSADGVNLGQMNTAIASAVSAGTITLTGNVTGSGTVGTPFATTIVSTLNNIPVATGAVNLNTQNIISVANLGIGVSAPTLRLQFNNATDLCKICLFQNAVNSYQVYGFGVSAAVLRYVVPATTSDHVFYAATSSTTDTEIFRIKGTGYASVTNGFGVGVTPTLPLQFDNGNAVCKIALSQSVANSYQVYGLGVDTNIFRYCVPATTSDHVFYAATSSTTNNELFRVYGDGRAKLAGNLGINIAPTLPLQFSNSLGTCKICLFQTASNSFQVYGFGIASGILRYSVDSSAASHVFYCGASSTTSTELFKISGTGYATVATGTGTFYSRVPSAHIYMSGVSAASPCTASTWRKAVGTTTASTGAVQFTTATTNRLTFTGSDLSQACVGTASASVTFVSNHPTVANVSFAIYKNGTTRLPGEMTVTSPINVTVLNIAITDIMVSLSPTDYLELWVMQNQTNDVIINSMNLSFKAC